MQGYPREPPWWPSGNAPAPKATDMGSIPPSLVKPYQPLKPGTLEAILPGAWHYRVNAWTGWPGISILCELATLICNFYLSVAVRTVVYTDLFLRYTLHVASIAGQFVNSCHCIKIIPTILNMVVQKERPTNGQTD